MTVSRRYVSGVVDTEMDYMDQLVLETKLRTGKVFFSCPSCGYEHYSDQEREAILDYRMGCVGCGAIFIIRDCELRSESVDAGKLKISEEQQ